MGKQLPKTTIGGRSVATNGQHGHRRSRLKIAELRQEALMNSFDDQLRTTPCS